MTSHLLGDAVSGHRPGALNRRPPTAAADIDSRNPGDHELAAALRRDDDAGVDMPAFAAVCAAELPQLRATIRRRVRDATLAEDLAQDAIERAWRYLRAGAAGRYGGPALLYQAARTVINLHFRSAAVRLHAAREPGSHDLPPVPDHADQVVGSIDARRELQHRLAALTAHQREDLFLSKAAGLPHAAIAATRGITPGTVKVRVCLARRAARAAQAAADTVPAVEPAAHDQPSQRGAIRPHRSAATGADPRRGGPTTSAPLRWRSVLVLAAALTATLVAGCRPDTAATTTPAASAAAHGVTAEAALARLPVKGRAPRTGYSRDQFGQRWADIDRDGCDQRNQVLARDLVDETLQGRCVVLAGTLHDPYSGQIIEFRRGPQTSDDVQIDHVVALSNAWQTGAQQLDPASRQRLGNDPLNLLAVDGQLNQAKGDSDAATWLPPNRRFRCAYVARQVAVKTKYQLWVTPAERDAIARILANCPQQPLPDPAGLAEAPPNGGW